MNLSRRHMLGLAGLGLASTTILAGCAGSGQSSGKAQDSDGPLQFWSNHPASSRDIEQKMVDAWNEKNPDHKAQLVDGGADYEELAQKFNASLAGGDLPDVIVGSDVTWFNFAFQDAIEPLDDLWNSEGISSDGYVQALLDDYKYKDKHYAVPYSRSTCIMYFRKDVMESAGLPTDRGPSTWDEFGEWMPKMVEANGGKPALTLPNGSAYLDWYFQAIVWGFGGSYSKEWDPKFTDPKTIEAGEFLKKHYDAGHISIVEDGANEFGIGKAASLVESTGSLGGINKLAHFDFYTTFLPGPAPACPTGGAGLAIPSGISDDRKKIAAKFIDFMTNTENTITFTQATGYMPVRTDAAEKPAEKDFLSKNPNAVTAINQMKSNIRPQDFARVSVSGGGERIGGALDKITSGHQEVKPVFEALQSETQKVIDRDIKPHL